MGVTMNYQQALGGMVVINGSLLLLKHIHSNEQALIGE